MPRNHRIRFMDNNFAELISSSITESSELSSFPFSNAINKFRSKVWKPSGHFLIESAVNDKIYINDGTDRTITLTAATYTTPASLASHVQTQLNASSSGWTVSYSTTTYKFTITRSSAGTLRYSQTTEAAWSTLGYTGSTDVIATSFVADEQRNHTSEFAVFDLGYAATITFFAAIGPLDEVFGISSAATIKLQANNLPQWSSPPLDLTLTRYDGGLFRFLDDQEDTGYRYWRFYYEDKYNPLGPEGISIGHIYLGDYTTFSNREVGHGYEKVINDPTNVSVSENGALYFDQKTKFSTFDGVSLEVLERDNKDYLETLFQAKGIHTPFYVSIDPLGNYTDSIDELTKYVVFADAPRFRHIYRDMFSTSLKLRELV